MKDLNAYIESGILESYLLGCTTENETLEIEALLIEHPQLQAELNEIATAMEQYATVQAIEPDPTIKPFLMATINFMKRMESGETPSFPPQLNEHSKPEDYAEWLNRPDMVLNEELQGVYARIIGYTPEQMTAIVWIERMAPEEVHTDEFEKFLILEGTCDIQIGEKVHHLVPGDCLTIPLYENHHVLVTSEIPCKVILQRVAA